MKTITAQKPLDEILQSIERHKSVYIMGCGNCATMLHTGGNIEVQEMKTNLEAAGKKVTGGTVIPIACDTLTKEALAENAEDIKATDCILVMACAFGVQTVSLYGDKPVYPALNTLFIGKEESPGYFSEVCAQCGNCVLAQTAGICPLVRCAKSLMHGPCGGSVEGKCEIDPNIPCAWQLIIDRLTALGQLDKLEEIQPPRDWGTSHSGGPRRITLKD